MALSLLAAQPGDSLEPMVFAPLTRHDFAMYCGASGDHNPLHTDIDFARDAAGLDDVIGHGMLSMALAGRFLTGLAPIGALRAFSTRFVGKIGAGDRLTCGGEVDSREEVAGTVLLALRIWMIAADGREILEGRARIALVLIADQ